MIPISPIARVDLPHLLGDEIRLLGRPCEVPRDIRLAAALAVAAVLALRGMITTRISVRGEESPPVRPGAVGRHASLVHLAGSLCAFTALCHLKPPPCKPLSTSIYP